MLYIDIKLTNHRKVKNKKIFVGLSMFVVVVIVV